MRVFDALSLLRPHDRHEEWLTVCKRCLRSLSSMSAYARDQQMRHLAPTIRSMSSSLVLNVLAVVVAFIALTVSVIFAMRQITIMRQANQMPVFVDLIQEYRSQDFQQAEHYVMYKLAREHTSSDGVLSLPSEARHAATVVLSFFGTVGSLIAFGILKEDIAVSTLGSRADKLWTDLEPFIIKERQRLGDSDFAKFFEDFVYRIRTNWPPEEHYGILIHRLPQPT